MHGLQVLWLEVILQGAAGTRRLPVVACDRRDPLVGSLELRTEKGRDLIAAQLAPDHRAEAVVADGLVRNVDAPVLQLPEEVGPEVLEAGGELAEIVQGDEEQRPFRQGVLAPSEPARPVAAKPIRPPEVRLGNRHHIEAVQNQRVPRRTITTCRRTRLSPMATEIHSPLDVLIVPGDKVTACPCAASS